MSLSAPGRASCQQGGLSSRFLEAPCAFSCLTESSALDPDRLTGRVGVCQLHGRLRAGWCWSQSRDVTSDFRPAGGRTAQERGNEASALSSQQEDFRGSRSLREWITYSSRGPLVFPTAAAGSSFHSTCSRRAVLTLYANTGPLVAAAWSPCKLLKCCSSKSESKTDALEGCTTNILLFCIPSVQNWGCAYFSLRS